MEQEENKEEKSMEENLTDPTFVNYNLLNKLEEIKRINYAILEVLNNVYNKTPKEDREGVFKPR